jgi:tartrate dehydrogenase/decarboxylase/D-malate dehydrogenase
MLEHLGEAEAASALRAGLGRVMADGKVRTRDLGGEAGTDAFAEAVAGALRNA